MKITLLKLARYNQWANKILINLIQTQTPELLEKEIDSSFNTLKKTILHMADAEYIWHCRLTNVPFDKIPSKMGVGIEELGIQDQKIIVFFKIKKIVFFGKT